MTRRMLTVRIEAELEKKLEELAREKIERKSDIIREALEEFIKKETEMKEIKRIMAKKFAEGKISFEELIKILGYQEARKTAFYIDIAKEWYKLLELNLKDVDACFHFAAKARIQPSIIDPRSTIENNIMCDFNTLELCRRNNINKIIYACSSTSYGLNPIPCVEDSKPDLLAPYSVSKHVGEMFCKIYWRTYDENLGKNIRDKKCLPKIFQCL